MVHDRTVEHGLGRDASMVDMSTARKDLPDGALIGDIQGLGGRARHVQERGRDRRARIGLSDYKAFGSHLIFSAGDVPWPGRSPRERRPRALRTMVPVS